MDQQYFVYEYITDERMNRIGIKFRHILETDPEYFKFEINVGKFYTIYYRKNRTYGRVIKVVRIVDGGIYYKVVNDYTGSGEINVTNMRLGTEENYMPMISISGSEMELPSVYFTLHNDVNIHEGGRNKRGRKSKKYSKTKSKSRTRRGGRRSRRGATKKKYKKARKH